LLRIGAGREPDAPDAPEATGRVDVNGARIFYAFYGSANAETVLLLHGGLGAGEDFGGRIPALFSVEPSPSPTC